MNARRVEPAPVAAFLRGLNVGGHRVTMDTLKKEFQAMGFRDARTFIASGNVVFESRAAPARVKSELEKRLLAHCGKPVGVLIRTGTEMAAVLKANPFPDAEPRHTYAIFLAERPARDALERVTGRQDEEPALGEREIFVRYPTGMGRSKLKIPAAKTGTARNMNTVAKLAEMASKP